MDRRRTPFRSFVAPSPPRRPRSGRAHKRIRRLFALGHPRRRVSFGEWHDLQDGRHVLQFESPAIDLMLYLDVDTTIAEWVTAHGALIALVKVGDA